MAPEAEVFASVNGSHMWTAMADLRRASRSPPWRRSRCCGACFATRASSPTPTPSSTPPTARLSAARRSSSARTPSSSSSPRSPRTTSRSRCARCRCSPSGSVELDGDRALGQGPRLPPAQHRRGRADAGADRGPAEVLPGRNAEQAVRQHRSRARSLARWSPTSRPSIQAADGTVEIGDAADRRSSTSRRCASCSRT